MAFAYGAPMSEEASVELLTAVAAAGYKHFDTSEIYASTFPQPHSEATVFGEVLMGKWLATVDRSSVSIATKCNPSALWGGKTDAATVAAMVEASLARLGTDYIDLYYLHRLPPQGPEEFFESMKPLIASGKVRAVGISEASPENLRKAHAVMPLAAAQYEWSLLTRELEKDIIPVCAELGIVLVAYSPLSRNLLAGAATADTIGGTFRAGQPRFQGDNLEANQKLVKVVAGLAEAKGVTPATLSLAWVLHKAAELGVEVLPIPGTTKAPHAAENIRAQDVSLSSEDMAALEALARGVVGERGAPWYMSGTYEAQVTAGSGGGDYAKPVKGISSAE